MAATVAPERSAVVAYENATVVSTKLAFTVALSVADDVDTSVASLVATVGLVATTAKARTGRTYNAWPLSVVYCTPLGKY